jgi:hypothetical protein
MRLPRMTMRRWMVAVAISGGLLTAERLRQRSVSYASIARFHGQEERKAVLQYQAVEAEYLRRCQRLRARGVAFPQAEIDSGLAEAKALWPKIREKGNPNRYGICTLGAPDNYYDRLAWDLGTQSDLSSRHSQLRRKYERAARYLWRPVEPDPPEP